MDFLGAPDHDHDDADESAFRRRVMADVATLKPTGLQDPELAELLLDGLLARTGPEFGPLSAERAAVLADALVAAADEAVDGEVEHPVVVERAELRARLHQVEERLADPGLMHNVSSRELLGRVLGRHR